MVVEKERKVRALSGDRVEETGGSGRRGRTGQENRVAAPQGQGQGSALRAWRESHHPPRRLISILSPQSAYSRNSELRGHSPGRVPGGSSRYTL